MAMVGAKPSKVSTPTPGWCGKMYFGVTVYVTVQSGLRKRNSRTSPAATSALMIWRPHSVSLLPLAAMSLAAPPEEPSSVQPAPLVSNVPVPPRRCVQA